MNYKPVPNKLPARVLELLRIGDLTTTAIARKLDVTNEEVSDAMRVPIERGVVAVFRCLPDKRASVYALIKRPADSDPFADDRSGRMRQLIVRAHTTRVHLNAVQDWASVIFKQKVEL